MNKKLIIKEIDKLKSAIHENRIVTEYLIYVMEDGNSQPLEAYTELGDSAKSVRVNELILINFSDDELSGFNKEEIIEEVSFEEYIKEFKKLWKK